MTPIWVAWPAAHGIDGPSNWLPCDDLCTLDLQSGTRFSMTQYLKRTHQERVSRFES